MKKSTILAFSLLSTGLLLGAQSAQAEEVYPTTANSNATVVLTGDDGESDGKPTGPGGGEDGGNGGEEIETPGGGNEGEGGVVNPGQNSSLRLSLLTAFDFGTIKMSGNTESYTAKLPTPNFVNGGPQERPNFVQVTDNRGNNAGWTLTAKLSEQFKNGASELTGSYITLNNGWAQAQAADNAQFAPTVSNDVILTTDASAPIANAQADEGMGTWNVLYGTLFEEDKATLGDATNSVKLTIPGSVKKTEGTYKAEIEWTLYNTPTI